MFQNLKSHFTLTLVFLFAGFSPLFAQQEDSHPAQANRFLFIMDTSSGMKKQQNDELKIVADLLVNSANGQMRSGDSLGVWTFNQEVYTELPAQTWTTEEQEQIVRRTMVFLQGRRYEKSSRFDRALADMRDVIQSSDLITVILISNGKSKMIGTPFDKEISELYKQTLADMKHSPKPVVTVLQARKGKVVHYTVSAPPWPVVIPEVPLPIRPALTQKNPAVTNAAPPITNSSAQPLIISGHPKPKVSAASNSPAPPAPLPTPTTNSATVPSNQPAPPVAPKPTLPPSASTGAPSSPVPPSQPSQPIAPPQTPTPPPIAPQVTSVPAKPETVTQAPKPTVSTPLPQPAPATSNAQRPPLPMAEQAARPVIPALPSPAAAPSNSSHHTASNIGKEVATSETPSAPVIAKNVTNAATPIVSKPVPSPISPSSSPTNSLSARTQAFVAPETAARPKTLLIAGLALLAVGLLLIVVLVRRSRSSASLITETMGNGRKE